MDLDPPAGSQISIDRKDLDPTIVIPATASSTRYFGGVFLLFWLGGWVMGETSAITQLTSGKGSAFIIFWLGGWPSAESSPRLRPIKYFVRPCPKHCS